MTEQEEKAYLLKKYGKPLLTRIEELAWLKEYQSQNGLKEWCKQQEREIREDLKRNPVAPEN